MIAKVNHVEIPVLDLEKAKKFYKEIIIINKILTIKLISEYYKIKDIIKFYPIIAQWWKELKWMKKKKCFKESYMMLEMSH